jgi:hypothetical protein
MTDDNDDDIVVRPNGIMEQSLRPMYQGRREHVRDWPSPEEFRLKDGSNAYRINRYKAHVEKTFGHEVSLLDCMAKCFP